MPTDSTAQRLLPHLRRVALAREAAAGDGPLLGAFIATRDEAAFAALVRRHGPMVLGVCRRVIGDPHLAEDAFQATFLVLARRAAAIRPRHLVGPWLYGVADRTARKARGAAARRHAKETSVDAVPHPAAPPEEVWADLQPVLDAELSRLPDRYRVPVVLCDLNGRPQREVARELKVSPATLARRLAAARKLLARRLTERGVVLSGGAVASALGWHAATSAVPPALAAAAVKAGCAVAAGTASGLPVPVVELSEGVMRMFVVQKLKALVAGAASGLVLLAGIGLLAGPGLRADPEATPAAPPAKARSPRTAEPAPASDSEDAAFLRRTSLDLRGVLPTALEMHYFLADSDAKKRAKVTGWMLARNPEPRAHGNWIAPRVPDTVDLKETGRKDVLEPRYSALVRTQTTARIAAQADLEAAQALAEQIRNLAPPGATGDAQRAEAEARVREAKARWNAAQQALAELQREREFEMALPVRVYLEYDGLLYEEFQRAMGRAAGQKDAEFLRRLSLDLRGTLPSVVEMNYFLADPDPNKREKVFGYLLAPSKPTAGRAKFVDELLADPEVQKRAGQLWRQWLAKDQLQAAPKSAGKATPTDRLDRLLKDLLDGEKADEQVLDALSLATLGRFPSETERRLILDGVRSQPDRSTGWGEVLRVLVATDEAKAHADGLARRAGK